MTYHHRKQPNSQNFHDKMETRHGTPFISPEVLAQCPSEAEHERLPRTNSQNFHDKMAPRQGTPFISPQVLAQCPSEAEHERLPRTMHVQGHNRQKDTTVSTDPSRGQNCCEAQVLVSARPCKTTGPSFIRETPNIVAEPAPALRPPPPTAKADDVAVKIGESVDIDTVTLSGNSS